MAMEVLKKFGSKVSYFKMLYELTKNKCFLSVRVAEILSVTLSDEYNSFWYTDFSYH